VKFDNLQEIEFFPISKKKLNNFGPRVQHGGTSQKNGRHWVNPRNMEFGSIGGNETSDISDLKVPCMAKGKIIDRKWKK
jgi:hypothetical protein